MDDESFESFMVAALPPGYDPVAPAGAMSEYDDRDVALRAC